MQWYTIHTGVRNYCSEKIFQIFMIHITKHLPKMYFNFYATILISFICIIFWEGYSPLQSNVGEIGVLDLSFSKIGSLEKKNRIFHHYLYTSCSHNLILHSCYPYGSLIFHAHISQWLWIFWEMSRF